MNKKDVIALIKKANPEDIVSKLEFVPLNSFLRDYPNLPPSKIGSANIFYFDIFSHQYGDEALTLLRDYVSIITSFRHRFMEALYNKHSEKIYPLEEFLI